MDFNILRFHLTFQFKALRLEIVGQWWLMMLMPIMWSSTEWQRMTESPQISGISRSLAVIMSPSFLTVITEHYTRWQCFATFDAISQLWTFQIGGLYWTLPRMGDRQESLRLTILQPICESLLWERSSLLQPPSRKKEIWSLLRGPVSQISWQDCICFLGG